MKEELSKDEARQGDGHTENRPPLFLGIVFAVAILAVILVVWLVAR